ncbi:MAG: transcriptional repressor LexA [Bacillota bacterium]|uniref:LexA repressor n=1 Tax=Thermanaerosceptrum fracticalcis TaxID=1712410 RepID=A0A7G6E0L6_THEFR|nr:transcriptional repressor LexA [Thermanaerosceptrum fracticalcis]QNB45620.1 transcriptional repressor LexA [Thermanaerosceptrum fracticalcis]
MYEDLTDRQVAIINYIKKEIKAKGYPPSVREIGEAVGLSSSSTVHNHLNQLESRGYIKRDPTKPRAIEVIDHNLRPNKEMVNVPIVGRVTAGSPILAVENIEDTFPLPLDFIKSEDVFILNVKGDSMIEAGIQDGDLVIVKKQNTARNGDIVVALLDDEATVKRFYKENSHIRLQPENSNYEPIITKDVLILGKVIALLRKY